MLDKEYVIKRHDELIENHGGSHGLRDDAGLDACINRPFATFDSLELYITVEAKAAAIFESLVIRHPFIDGNKRIAYFMLEAFLAIEDKEMKLSLDDAYALPNDVAMGKYTIETLSEYIKRNSGLLDE